MRPPLKLANIYAARQAKAEASVGTEKKVASELTKAPLVKEVPTVIEPETERSERNRQAAEAKVEQERKDREAIALQKQEETDRLLADAKEKKRLADKAEKPERDAIETEKQNRRDTFDRIAAELGYEPSRKDTYQSWTDFSEDRVREYIGQRLVQPQIDEAAEKAGIIATNSLKLAVFVVRGQATVDRIIELLKAGQDYSAIKAIVTSDEVVEATSENDIVPLREARIKIEQIATETGYTPEIGGEGFHAKIDSFAKRLADEKGTSNAEQVILDARSSFAAVVSAAHMGEEE